MAPDPGPAAGVLSRALGRPVALEGVTLLREGPRSTVLRCHVRPPPATLPDLTRGWPRPAHGGGQAPAPRLVPRLHGLGGAALPGLAGRGREGLAPRVLGGDASARVVLLEDLGPGGSLDALLQAPPGPAAVQAVRDACLALAGQYARLHVATRGQESRLRPGLWRDPAGGAGRAARGGPALDKGAGAGTGLAGRRRVPRRPGIRGRVRAGRRRLRRARRLAHLHPRRPGPHQQPRDLRGTRQGEGPPAPPSPCWTSSTGPSATPCTTSPPGTSSAPSPATCWRRCAGATAPAWAPPSPPLPQGASARPGGRWSPSAPWPSCPGFRPASWTRTPPGWATGRRGRPSWWRSAASAGPSPARRTLAPIRRTAGHLESRLRARWAGDGALPEGDHVPRWPALSPAAAPAPA